MSKNVDAFDAWIRSSFVDLNTALEELYSRRKTVSLDGLHDLKAP